MSEEQKAPAFRGLGLSKPILQALTRVSYEVPSLIQAQIIQLPLSGLVVGG